MKKLVLLILAILSLTISYCGNKKDYNTKSTVNNNKHYEFEVKSLKDLKYGARIVIDRLKKDKE